MTETPEARARRYQAAISAGVLTPSEVAVLETAREYATAEYPALGWSTAQFGQAAKALTSDAPEPEGIAVPEGWKVVEAILPPGSHIVLGPDGLPALTVCGDQHIHLGDAADAEVPVGPLVNALRAAGWVVGRPRG